MEQARLRAVPLLAGLGLGGQANRPECESLR
jgi:hypothetical protein